MRGLGLLEGKPKTMGEYFGLNRKRQDVAKAYSKFWSENKLDAILMPPAPHTALPENTWATASYTALWNLLDYPSFVLPVGVVKETDKADGSEKEFYNAFDEKLYKLCKFSLNLYVEKTTDTSTF